MARITSFILAIVVLSGYHCVHAQLQGNPCKIHADCQLGYMCGKLGNCIQVGPPPCNNYGDCKIGQMCGIHGHCEPVGPIPCNNDGQCLIGQMCNRLSGKCVNTGIFYWR